MSAFEFLSELWWVLGIDAVLLSMAWLCGKLGITARNYGAF